MEFILMGQPNCGKSTIFNEVVGYKSITSNFPGATVHYTRGDMILEEEEVSVVDLPGTYSLQTSDESELAAVQYLLSASDDAVIINIIDATVLSRSLELTLQLMELRRPMVIGLNMVDVQQTLIEQNLVVNAGGVDVQDERLRIQVTGEFTTMDEIGDMIIRGRSTTGSNDVRELLRVQDVSTVRRGYVEPATWEMRYNGRMAIGVSISNVSGENIVKLGELIDTRLNELIADLPVGIEVHRISWQSALVQESIDTFLINLAEAVAIVLFVLWIATGLKTALIVGLCGLVFTIIASFVFMKIFGIDLQRMSLGALVIAMGMMVDNAIVVADGILVRLQQGKDKIKAAVEAATQPSIPLLGATIIAVMTFYPIAASNESAGEYCVSLFYVVAISLLISWVLAVTITPLMCIGILKLPKKNGHDSDPYGGVMYRFFKSLQMFGFRQVAVKGFLEMFDFGGVSDERGASRHW